MEFEYTTGGVPYIADFIYSYKVFVTLYPGKAFKTEQIEVAKEEIKTKYDSFIFTIRVANVNDYDSIYKAQVIEEALLLDVDPFALLLDNADIRRERKKGTTPAEFVATHVLPHAEETKKKFLGQYGENIFDF